MLQDKATPKIKVRSVFMASLGAYTAYVQTKSGCWHTGNGSTVDEALASLDYEVSRCSICNPRERMEIIRKPVITNRWPFFKWSKEFKIIPAHDGLTKWQRIKSWFNGS